MRICFSVHLSDLMSNSFIELFGMFDAVHECDVLGNHEACVACCTFKTNNAFVSGC